MQFSALDKLSKVESGNAEDFTYKTSIRAEYQAMINEEEYFRGRTKLPCYDNSSTKASPKASSQHNKGPSDLMHAREKVPPPLFPPPPSSRRILRPR